MSRLFLASLCLLLSCSSLFAQQRNLGVGRSEAPASEKRVALVIGNSAYKNSPLRNPVNDARDMAAKLRALGFEVVERSNLNARQIGATLREFRSKLVPGAIGLVFYAGHGLQIKGENFLPAVDAEIAGEEDVQNQSLAVKQVMDVLEDAKTRLNLVFLDACRNNPYARSFRSGSDGLARVSAPSGTLISFATRPGSVAADGSGRNGLYTTQLLQQMDKLDQPIEQVLKRVVTGVKLASNGRQEPWMEGSIEGDFCFGRCAGAAPATAPSASAATAGAGAEAAANDRAFWESVKDSKSADEFRAYLERFPDGLFVALAHARLRALPETQSASAPPSARPPSSAAGSTPQAQLLDDCAQCRGILERQGPAVVAVSASVREAQGGAASRDDFFDKFFGSEPDSAGQQRQDPRRRGAGFLISSDGYILTNARLVQRATQVRVTLADRREFGAKIMGTDARSDVALLKIDSGAERLPVVRFAAGGMPAEGERLLAMGYPSAASLTIGVVVGAGGAQPANLLAPFIRTDAPVNSGNIGGPLFNLRGEVVGINTLIQGQSETGADAAYAIPIDLASEVEAQLRAFGRVRRARIGTAIQEVTKEIAQNLGLPKPLGAAVNAVEKGGPAERAGIEVGDVILSFDGIAINSHVELPRIVARQAPGRSVPIQVWRKGAAKDLTVTLAETPPEAARERSGEAPRGSR